MHVYLEHLLKHDAMHILFHKSWQYIYDSNMWTNGVVHVLVTRGWQVSDYIRHLRYPATIFNPASLSLTIPKCVTSEFEPTSYDKAL